MGVSRCRVAFIDSEGITHAVEVHADSLYEAVALAVAEFRTDDLTAAPGPMTEFTVSIQRPAIEHRIRLSQVSRWAEGNTREGPAGITKRQRIRALLENRMSESGIVPTCTFTVGGASDTALAFLANFRIANHLGAIVSRLPDTCGDMIAGFQRCADQKHRHEDSS